MHDTRISSEEFDALPKHGKIGQWVTWRGKLCCTSQFTVVGPTIHHDLNSPEWAQYVAESAAWLASKNGRT
jgi:hypothetical protein